MKIFVYGTLKKGFGNHRLIKEARFLGESFIKGTMYSMGAFPGVVLKGDNNIKGEVYEVDEGQLFSMDRLEGHPNFYRRTPIKTVDGEDVETYVINSEYIHSRHEVTSGDWGKN
jgi:gamma-glutamylaminecyclotransferase